MLSLAASLFNLFLVFWEIVSLPRRRSPADVRASSRSGSFGSSVFFFFFSICFQSRNFKYLTYGEQTRKSSSLKSKPGDVAVPDGARAFVRNKESHACAVFVLDYNPQVKREERKKNTVTQAQICIPPIRVYVNHFFPRLRIPSGMCRVDELTSIRARRKREGIVKRDRDVENGRMRSDAHDTRAKEEKEARLLRT